MLPSKDRLYRLVNNPLGVHWPESIDAVLSSMSAGALERPAAAAALTIVLEKIHAERDERTAERLRLLYATDERLVALARTALAGLAALSATDVCSLAYTTDRLFRATSGEGASLARDIAASAAALLEKSQPADVPAEASVLCRTAAGAMLAPSLTAWFHQHIEANYHSYAKADICAVLAAAVRSGRNDAQTTSLVDALGERFARDAVQRGPALAFHSPRSFADTLLLLSAYESRSRAWHVRDDARYDAIAAAALGPLQSGWFGPREAETLLAAFGERPFVPLALIEASANTVAGSGGSVVLGWAESLAKAVLSGAAAPSAAALVARAPAAVRLLNELSAGDFPADEAWVLGSLTAALNAGPAERATDALAASLRGPSAKSALDVFALATNSRLCTEASLWQAVLGPTGAPLSPTSDGLSVAYRPLFAVATARALAPLVPKLALAGEVRARIVQSALTHAAPSVDQRYALNE